MNIADLFYTVRGEGFNTLDSQINSSSKKMTQFASAMNEGITKPLLGLGKTVVDTTMTFDKQMSRVSAVTGETGENLTTMRELAKDMGETTSKSATEAGEAIEYMGLAGWDLKEIQEGLEPVLRASEAGVMDLGTTSDLVTDSMSALGIETSDLSRYLDIASQAQNNSNQSMEQFLNAMVTAGGTFKMFNTPLEEAGSLLGILANRGFKGTEAGNALTSIMANLTTGAGQAGEAMSDLGIEVYDENDKFVGMTSILEQLNTEFDGMSEAQRNTYIQMIGGKTRTKELNALLNGTSEELGELSESLYNSEGSLNSMADTMQDNLAGQITSLQSKAEGLAITFGEYLVPYVSKVVDWITMLADKFQNLSPKTQKIITVILAIIAIIPPLILGFSGIVSIIGFVGGAFTAVGGFIAGLSTPILVIIGIISALIVSFVAWIAKSEELRDKIKETFSNIIEYVRTHIEDFKIKINEIKEYLQGFVDWLIELFAPIGEMLKTSWESFDTTSIIEAWNLLKATLDPVIVALQLIAEILGGALAIAVGIIVGVINGLVSCFDEVIAIILNLVGIVTSAFGIIVGIIQGDTDMIKESFKNLWDNVVALFKNTFKGLLDLVSGFIEGVIKFFVSLDKSLGGKVSTMVKNLIQKWEDFKESATNKIKSFIDGAKGLFDDLSDKASDIMSDIMGFIQPVIDAFNDLKGAVGGVIDKISNISFPSMPDWVPSFATGVKNFSGGYAIVGEKGEELVQLPRGSNVYTHEETKAILNKKGTQQTAVAQPINKVNNYNISGLTVNLEDLEDLNRLKAIIDKFTNKIIAY